MKVEVLVSTMDQDDFSLVRQMNLTSDAIIINQCNRHSFEEFLSPYGKNIKMYSYNERGVGKSRNSALMRSNADICLMADDDMKYVDGYEELIIDAFRETPKADIILFNVPITKKDGQKIVKVKRNERIRFLNSLKYGTVNIAFKRNKIVQNNIFFSLLFGGGANYGSGEDSLFITECLKKGLKIYSNTAVIAEINEGNSTWFSGYNEKYFYDRGALFSAISKKLAYLLALQFIVRKKKLYKNEISPKAALNSMLKGIKNFNS